MAIRNRKELLCSENWIGAVGAVAAMMPDGEVEEADGVTLIKSGLESAEFNMVYAVEKPKETGKLKDRITVLFLENNLPWQIVTIPETSEFVKPIMDELGLSMKEVVPGMVLDPIPNGNPSLPLNLEIREVRSIDDLALFFEVSGLSFGVDLITNNGSAPDIMTGKMDVSGFSGALYLGFVEGVPVATSLRYTKGNVAGIYFVGTVQQYRRRGIGEAMTWRAIVEGRREGCVTSCLQATEMGRPLYERMGFETVIEYQLWR